jgi:hypothetical protein
VLFPLRQRLYLTSVTNKDTLQIVVVHRLLVMYFVKVKGKIHPITGHGGPEGGLRSIALLFL